MARKPDDVNVFVLNLLQDHGRITFTRLAAIVGRSVPAVSARIRRLEVQGFLSGNHAVLNHHRLGLHATAFALVHLQHARDGLAFADFAASRADILEDHALAGSPDHFVKLRTTGVVELQSLLEAIENRPGVLSIKVDRVTQSFKETRRIPVRTSGDVEPQSNGHKGSAPGESIES